MEGPAVGIVLNKIRQLRIVKGRRRGGRAQILGGGQAINGKDLIGLHQTEGVQDVGPGIRGPDRGAEQGSGILEMGILIQHVGIVLPVFLRDQDLDEIFALLQDDLPQLFPLQMVFCPFSKDGEAVMEIHGEVPDFPEQLLFFGRQLQDLLFLLLFPEAKPLLLPFGP